MALGGEAHMSSAGTRSRSQNAIQENGGLDRAFRLIFFTALVISVFHYADNSLRYDSYVVSPDVLTPPLFSIVLAWVLFTVAGVFAYLNYQKRNWWPAVVLLAVYSLSGFVGIGHYIGTDLSKFDVVQHILIVTDILAGIAALIFAGVLMFRRALPALERLAD